MTTRIDTPLHPALARASRSIPPLRVRRLRSTGATLRPRRCATSSPCHRADTTSGFIATGYVPYVTDMDVTGPGSRLNVDMAWLDPMPPELATHLRMDIHPIGGRATFDGRPLAFDGLEALPPGPHHVVLEHPDFRRIERDVILEPRATQTGRRLATLADDGASAARLDQRRGSRLPLSIVGGVIAVSGLAATVVGLLRVQVVQDTTAWNIFVVALAAPALISGLVVLAVSSVRYFTIPRLERYRPPRGHTQFMLSREGLGVSWY